jgi:hypothetical protein
MTVSDEGLAWARNISAAQVRLLRQSRGTTNETLGALPGAALRQALHRPAYPDRPALRAAFRFRQAVGGGADLSATLPTAPVRAVTVHPRRAGFVYAGTEVGLFASEDSGTTWTPTNEGPTNCSVDDLFWMGETLISVTHGRGMYRIDLSGV